MPKNKYNVSYYLTANGKIPLACKKNVWILLIKALILVFKLQGVDGIGINADKTVAMS